MHLDAQILRAIARLSRKSQPATLSEIELRVAAEPHEIRTALVRLARSELVTRRAHEVRLTMFGLAAAVATSALPRRPSSSSTKSAAAPSRSGKKLRAA
jgi:Mn-dependent DtxR family transcriptional regulator